MGTISDLIIYALRSAVEFVSRIYRAIPGSVDYLMYGFLICAVLGLLIMPLRGAGLGTLIAGQSDTASRGLKKVSKRVEKDYKKDNVKMF